ncbi:hypothetical protein V2J09_022441 [Rumex salicifolius]
MLTRNKFRERFKVGDSSTKSSDRVENEVNLGIGFNDMDFSDRVLQLHITPLPSNKRLRGEKYVNCFSSIDADHSESGSDFILKTFNICSLVLASKSPFFFKLFKNDMKESQKKDEVILRINASEEAALMDLLQFMYDKPLKASSAPELVDVLMAEDKFEVPSCMRHCVQLLLKLPMISESALLYLELPPSIFMGKVTRPHFHRVNTLSPCEYWGFHLFNISDVDLLLSRQDEAMSLPLYALEALLGSDDLKVKSDEAVLDFILKWACLHYSKMEERRKILTNHLVRFICFPCVSSLKLKECQSWCLMPSLPRLNNPMATNLFPSIPLCAQNEVLATCGFPRRVNHRRIVYFDIKKQECMDKLQPGKRFYSGTFCLGGRSFNLLAQRSTYQSVEKFGLFLEMTGSESCILDYEFAVMKKPSREFQTQFTFSKSSLMKTERAKGEWLFD